MDHNGYHCPNQKLGHVPNVPRDEAHTMYRASMKAQHRTMPDGPGAGKGWYLAQNLRKANFVMDQRKNWKRQQQQQAGQQSYGGYPQQQQQQQHERK